MNTTSIRSKKVPPRATRMMEGLRDTGYDFNTAMADIIDNSIAANANIIDIHIKMDMVGEVSIYIADNGDGMNEAALEEAMTYGSTERPNPKSLGKFGLGLKTASTAFCRCLSVSSKAGKEEPIVKARWDLDFIVNVAKDWELLYPDVEPFELELFDKVADNNSGTVVTWEKIDRLIRDYADKTGSNARRALEKVEKQLHEHIALVFGRFLDEAFTEAPNVKININEVPVVAWDPFLKNNSLTILAAKQAVPVEFDEGVKSSFNINAYVIPRREEFATDEEYQDAKINNDLQGFYVYRENRLIHYGGWMGMFTKDPHYSLIRVEFSFDYTLDDAFNVDIKKSRIMLRGELYNWLKEKFLGAPRRVANERYRKGINNSVSKKAKNGAHDASNKNIGSQEQNVQVTKTKVTNAATGEVELQNKGGRFTIKLPLLDSAKDGEFYVTAVDSIDDGMLWEPAIIDYEHHAIKINTKHPYYHKVYMPNINSSVTIQGMDSLLWALGEAELNNMSDKTEQVFKDLRYEVSRILRRLVDDLPEPEIADEQA
ncbi:ATP-binding protein [Paenibacillus nanensis]|uniref:ATP-binding protein n=1 Tax=Paenibacillus nanensis TaxID=393251 RepID=A0A3A1VHZ1_9BACL|nr:ATP-binding protein [Paenibacillus nanensis]RIX60107.1 ATP-binding protein [Paenibacillus nanensis]